MNAGHDLRYATRVLLKSPGFALTGVITLALGIGVTTAIFSVCDALLWRPVPLPNLDSLAVVLQKVTDNPNDWNSVTPADFDDIRRDNTSFEALAGWEGGLANLAGGGSSPERVIQSLVTANFFDVIGLQPARGRAFQPGDDQPGREREVILSDGLWRRRFGGDSGIVGKSIHLDDAAYTVTGIMPASFDFPKATEIWTPMALTPVQRVSRTAQILQCIGRLKPGRSVQQAESELDSIAGRLAKDHPDSNVNRRFLAWPSLKFLVDYTTSQYLVMLLGSVMFVLLIACANVANLQFARAAGRSREIALRTALGARRGRIVVQLLTESVLLAVCGGALGLVVARWGISLMRAGMPPEIERYILGWKDIHLDGRALAFTLAAAVVSGILAGLAPAWQCSRTNVADALKEGGRGSSAGKSRKRLRSVLVASEIALSVVLLVGAGLMIRGFGTLIDRGRAFDPGTLLTLRLAITETKYREPYQIAGFYTQVLERLRSIPGVRSATAVSALPYSDHSSGRNFTIEGKPLEPGNPPSAMYQVTSPEYFETLRVPLKDGRFLNGGDGSRAPAVALVSESMAKTWWKDRSPIGARIKIGEPDSKFAWMTVAGVVGDVIHNPYDRAPRRAVYVPYEQLPARWMDIAVRTAGDPLLLAPAVTAAIRSLDPEQPIGDMRTMEKEIDNRAIGLTYMAALMGIFGGMALFLSAIGVYGVMANLVSEQTHEIGVRMALGAPRNQVLEMIMRRGLFVTGIGLAIGMPLAFGFARLMSSLIYGVTATDAITFTGIPLALLAAAALAIYLPARRAMNIDPIVALRYE